MIQACRSSQNGLEWNWRSDRKSYKLLILFGQCTVEGKKLLLQQHQRVLLDRSWSDIKTSRAVSLQLKMIKLRIERLIPCFARMLCCQLSLIKDIITTLQSHERLQKLSAEFLLKLIESLGQHSLVADEMKILIKLLQVC